MAKAYLGKDKYGRNLSMEYCDACAHEQYEPMLHETLYNVGDSSIVLCELHAVHFRVCPSYPGFQEQWTKAEVLAKKRKFLRLQLAASLDHNGEPAHVHEPGEQPSGTEDCAHHEVDGVE